MGDTQVERGETEGGRSGQAAAAAVGAAVAVAAPTRAFRFAAICTAGSVLGGAAGYAIGYWAYDTMGQPIVDAYHGHEVMIQIQAWYDEYGFWGTLLAAITPIPYKIFTISAGLVGMSLIPFILASLVGRGARFFLVATVEQWRRLSKNSNKSIPILAMLNMIPRPSGQLSSTQLVRPFKKRVLLRTTSRLSE